MASSRRLALGCRCCGIIVMSRGASLHTPVSSLEKGHLHVHVVLHTALVRGFGDFRGRPALRDRPLDLPVCLALTLGRSSPAFCECLLCRVPGCLGHELFESRDHPCPVYLLVVPSARPTRGLPVWEGWRVSFRLRRPSPWLACGRGGSGTAPATPEAQRPSGFAFGFLVL